ncbi:MAG TPA: ABC transporter permease [Terriglobales bacterium]|jgi:predicted permease|nr:ABC transporter permease [Terriglobales bacterium]
MQILDDIRYALRQFSHAPGFTATAILTLALGIGATTAIFSLVHAVMLKSLPVTKPEELVRIGDTVNCCINGGLQDDWSLFSYDQYTTFRNQVPGFTELAGFQAGRSLFGVRRNGTNQNSASYLGEFVSGNYFTTFGVGAYAGRMLTNADDHKGADPVAVISYRAWKEKYGQDPSVVGGAFTINGHPVTVVGIAPPGFFGEQLREDPPSFWFPLGIEPLLNGTSSILDRTDEQWLDIIGRLAPGADSKAMETQANVVLRQWLISPPSRLRSEELKLVPKQTLRFSPGGAGVQVMRDEYEAGLRLLLWVSGLVLMIACANVANLMLVRAAARKQHTSIRAALGAPRSRLMRQVLTESAVLGLLGGLGGIAVAYAGIRLILHLAFQQTYVPISAAPSLPVLGFAFAVSLLTGMLFGVAPAWVTARCDPAEALRGASRSTAQHGAWTQKSLVVVQAALSLVLLCTAGLLALSLRNLQRRDFGFQMPNRYIAHIDPLMAGYQPDQLDVFNRRLRDAIAAIPGVAQVSLSLYTPMEGDNWQETVYIQGQAPPPPDSNENSASWVRVTDGYFETLGTRILQGRSIAPQDALGTQNIAVVNQTFARKFFKDQNPIGQHFGYLEAKFAGNFEIVGVTEDTVYQNPRRPVRPMFFLPAAQHVTYEDHRWQQFEDRSHYMGAIELRTQGPISGLEAQLRRALAGVHPDLTLIDFTSFAAQVDGNFTQPAMIAKLTSLFGLVALLLASIGLYGVTAYSVERRTSEIGIRMALGAGPVNVLKLVLSGALWQIGLALLIGIPVTIAAGYAMAAQLFGVRPYDPRILLTTTMVLSLAALIAAVVPARRAATIDPMQALRTE